MKSFCRYMALIAILLTLQACADTFGSSSVSSEPTASSPAQTYFDQFSDVPIPSEMSVDRKRSLATTTQDGIRIGLITVTGRVDVLSLSNAMISNMSRNGWTLRAATTGLKTMQIYEKGIQFCVIYTYEETFTTVMEIWGAQRLGEGVFPASSSPSFMLESTSPAGSDTPIY